MENNEAYRRELVSRDDMQHINEKILRDYWIRNNKRPIDPMECPPGIRRIIEHGYISDSARAMYVLEDLE